MTLLLLALAQAAVQPPPPSEWSEVPVVDRIGPDRLEATDSVAIMRLAEGRRECRRGIGPTARMPDEPNRRMYGLNMDVLVLVAPDGRFLQILAAPGPCNAIRNHARTIVNVRYRGNVRGPEGAEPAWRRVRLGFSWSAD
jgi:hypothetical protein